MYFEVVVNDAVRDVKESGAGYVFFREQLDEVIRKLNKMGINVEYKEKQGVYSIQKIDTKQAK